MSGSAIDPSRLKMRCMAYSRNTYRRNQLQVRLPVLFPDPFLRAP